jgi:signal transduction histidine kinase/ActR/RegA family two-component response regulator
MAADLGPEGERVLLVAPTARDAAVTCSLLLRADVRCESYGTLLELAKQMKRGVGAVMLTDRVLFDRDFEAILQVLEQQPPWSDVPVVLLTQGQQSTPKAMAVLPRLSNLTLLDRPTSTRSMISAVQAALRARRRQYQLRDQMQAQARAQQALREADRRKDEFLATLAHELRNPLAPLSTGLQLMNTELDDRRALSIRHMMERQVNQLVRLINDLLDVSRISTGKVVLQLNRIDMRTVIESALESSQPAVAASEHTLRVHLPDTPVWVMGDAARLEQVICNLVNNACKYTPKRGNITVTLTQQGESAIARVIDDGLGIPPHMVPLVFEMFTQIDRNLDRAQGGLGIGLSLVRSLMELHGGEVHAESAGERAGSTFTISLPVVVQESSSLPASVSAAATAASRPLRVLVVDDNHDAADSLSLLLETLGHRTRTVYGGAAALDAAADFQPDTIFCDLGMPVVSGFEVAARLRSDSRRPPPVLVAVTGWGTDQDKRRASEGGFDLHITKPISSEDLDAVLLRASATSRSRASQRANG